MQPCSVANSRRKFSSQIPVANSRRNFPLQLIPSPFPVFPTRPLRMFYHSLRGIFPRKFPRRTRSCFTTQPFQLSIQSFPDRVSDLARTVPVGRPVGQDRGHAVCSGVASVRCHVFRARIRSGFRSVFPSRCPGRLSVSHVSGRLSGVHSGLQPLRVRLQVPSGSVPLGCIRSFLAVAARPCRLFARQPGGFVAPCGSDLLLPDRRVTGCQRCRSAGTNPDAKIAKKFYRAFPPARPSPSILSAHPCPSILSEHSRPSIPVRSLLPRMPAVAFYPAFCPEHPFPAVPVRITAPVPPFALPLSGSSGPERLCPSSDSSFVVSSGSPHRFLHSRCPCPDRPHRFLHSRCPCPDPPACREKTDSRPVASVSQRRRDFDAREFGRSAKSS